ncbi:predicted protein [Histoplasma capsulatum H143]|uniref:Uncharacterized protein n=1 Tax=Ajellomyces capsulatus (strain H143) TaxID=544712 RepID=C6HDC6_AJECH|nr:predicted protein [Histoplasma capsulatum H143]
MPCDEEIGQELASVAYPLPICHCSEFDMGNTRAQNYSARFWVLQLALDHQTSKSPLFLLVHPPHSLRQNPYTSYGPAIAFSKNFVSAEVGFRFSSGSLDASRRTPPVDIHVVITRTYRTEWILGISPQLLPPLVLRVIMEIITLQIGIRMQECRSQDCQLVPLDASLAVPSMSYIFWIAPPVFVVTYLS